MIHSLYRHWVCVKHIMCGSAMNQDHLPSTVICSSSSTWHCCRLWVSFLPSRPGKWRYLSSTTQSLLQHWFISQALSLWHLFSSHSYLEATSTSAVGYSLEGLCYWQLSFLSSCFYPRYDVAALYMFCTVYPCWHLSVCNQPIILWTFTTLRCWICTLILMVRKSSVRAPQWLAWSQLTSSNLLLKIAPLLRQRKLHPVWRKLWGGSVNLKRSSVS